MPFGHLTTLANYFGSQSGPSDLIALESNGLRPFDEEQAGLRPACVLRQMGPKDPFDLYRNWPFGPVALRVNQVLRT